MAPLTKVTLVGANGNLGSKLLPALLGANLSVTALLREGSTSKLEAHPNLTTRFVDADFALPALQEVLAGQDAVIAAFPLPNRLDHHLRLAYAAAAAGVKRFIPADFGSCDAASPEALKRLKIYRDKTRVRERCEELAREFPGSFSWTALVCGHFFDWGLRDGLLQFDLDKREALILDDGEAPASASTLKRVGEATVRILERPEVTANRTVFVQSFLASQNRLLASVEKATGAKWTVKRDEAMAYLDRMSSNLSPEGTGDWHYIEGIVFALGALDADWSKKDGFAMELLGLEDEDLDEVVQRIVDEKKAQA